MVEILFLAMGIAYNNFRNKVYVCMRLCTRVAI